MATSAAAADKQVKPLKIPMARKLVVEKQAVMVARTPCEKRAAIKEYTNKKRMLLRAIAIEKFAVRALHAPRDDKGSSKTQGIKPLRVANTLTFAVAWEAEFRTLYCNLFHDASNSLGAQHERLQRLRCELQGAAWIEVPQFLLADVLARGRRKAGSAPGRDGITWEALTSLPFSAIQHLCKLFEDRINGVPYACEGVDSWCQVVISLIPKVPNPEFAKQ